AVTPTPRRSSTPPLVSGPAFLPRLQLSIGGIGALLKSPLWRFGERHLDHWGHVFSAALAGGGVERGVVYGSSDRQGGFPLDGRVEPQDLTATVYHCLDYHPETVIHDPLGRPFPISHGQPIESVLL
ncbi:DUF1501 domain-containing protein, partial [Pirellulales bacterium]|nr:DUF1501 domain-containing protein [Pirellulales bacterium]